MDKGVSGLGAQRRENPLGQIGQAQQKGWGIGSKSGKVISAKLGTSLSLLCPPVPDVVPILADIYQIHILGRRFSFVPHILLHLFSPYCKGDACSLQKPSGIIDLDRKNL